MNSRPDEQREAGRKSLEREQARGPADYDESGGTGLEPRPGDAVIGGGVSGSDEDPIGGPGLPDEAAPTRRGRSRDMNASERRPQQESDT